MKTGEFDVMFLDHMMPEMDGIETLKYLQEMSLVKDTKIIALTANAVVGAKEQYLRAGFDDYLSKPIDIPELEMLLKKHLPEGIVEEKGGESPEGEQPENVSTGSIRTTGIIIENSENAELTITNLYIKNQ